MTDTAGRPWAGRAFEASPWAGDDGRAPAAFLAARAAFDAGCVGPGAVLDSLREARLLVPLLAEPGADDDPADLRRRHTAELAVPTVAGPDGRRVLPAFSSAEAMARWNPAGRPVPAPARQVALGAAADGTELVVIDPGSPTLFGLRRGAVEALARGIEWRPSWHDGEVHAAIRSVAARHPEVFAVDVEAGDPSCSLAAPELQIVLALAPGLADRAVATLLAEVQAAWRTDPVIAARVDSITVALDPAA